MSCQVFALKVVGKRRVFVTTKLCAAGLSFRPRSYDWILRFFVVLPNPYRQMTGYSFKFVKRFVLAFFFK
jgi:hypothetical protein